MIIANTPAAIGSDRTSVQIKTPAHDWQELLPATKTIVAKKIIDLLAR
jgi:hypothetical protein